MFIGMVELPDEKGAPGSRRTRSALLNVFELDSMAR
jgi:hypothetical protein